MMQEEDFQGWLWLPRQDCYQPWDLVARKRPPTIALRGQGRTLGAVIWLRQERELWQLPDELQNQTCLTRFCPTVCCTGGTAPPWIMGNFPAFFISHTSFHQSSAPSSEVMESMKGCILSILPFPCRYRLN